jgi:hypothetical protein
LIQRKRGHAMVSMGRYGGQCRGVGGLCDAQIFPISQPSFVDVHLECRHFF